MPKDTPPTTTEAPASTGLPPLPIAQLVLPRPTEMGAGDEDADQVVDHDEFRQIMIDVRNSRDALEVLVSLLRLGSVESLNLCTGNGLGVLLEAVHTRTNMAADALQTMARELSIEA